jgi:phospholipase/carboxylesterase
MQPSFLEIKPLDPVARTLVVFFHGVGSDAKDLIGIVPYMQESLADAHFLSLNGLQRYDMAHFGYQWFSLQNRDSQIMQTEIEKTAPLVINFLEAKLDEMKLTYKDLFLVGFSQGTMLATYIATCFERELAGIVGFAGAIIPNPNFQGNIKTPICFIHGKNDEVLRVEMMRQSVDHLKNIGFSVESHEIPFLTHSIDMECIKIATNFIKNNYESSTR